MSGLTGARTGCVRRVGLSVSTGWLLRLPVCVVVYCLLVLQSGLAKCIDAYVGSQPTHLHSPAQHVRLHATLQQHTQTLTLTNQLRPRTTRASYISPPPNSSGLETLALPQSIGVSLNSALACASPPCLTGAWWRQIRWVFRVFGNVYYTCVGFRCVALLFEGFELS